jgi:hypothetical protein
MSSIEKPRKLVAVLNKQISGGVALNALGHMAFGLAGLVAKSGGLESMNLVDYIDKDGGVHPSVCYYPFIVLRAGAGQLRTLREQAMANNIHFVDFLDTMTVGSSDEQVAKTKEIAKADLVCYGVCMFGDKAAIEQLTRKFSLWRD